jgi:hypothetical protein
MLSKASLYCGHTQTCATKKRIISYSIMKLTKTPPKRRFFSVRLTDKEYQNLHQVSIKLDLKPSEFIRRQITELLKHGQ